MKTIFKFTGESNSLDFFMEEMGEIKIGDTYDAYTRIEKPEAIPDCAVRHGEYWVRSKGYRHIYYYVKPLDMWFTCTGREYDRKYYALDLTEWNLFPQLPAREYDKMRSIPYKRLSLQWRNNLWGYIHWMEFREMRRDMHKSFMRWDKEDNISLTK